MLTPAGGWQVQRSVRFAAGSTVVLSACNTARGEVSRTGPFGFLVLSVGVFVHGHSSVVGHLTTWHALHPSTNNSVLKTLRPHRTVTCRKKTRHFEPPQNKTVNKTRFRMQVRGEGVLGLSRAFMGAGAGAVVVSLWSVNDKSTGLLMKAMYAALLRGACPERCWNCTHPQG